MPKRFLLVLGIFVGSWALILGSNHLLRTDTVLAVSSGSQSDDQKAAVSNNTENTGECAISSGYPEKVYRWCSLITQHARHHGIDPNLIAALILQESGGNPDAYSKSGAVGLMQVMPRDGLAASFMCINGPCFANRPSMDELYDPQFNVEYGSRFLAGLIKRHGDNREALKYYGPANVGYYYADIVLAIYARY